jgi:hypothetical protein
MIPAPRFLISFYGALAIAASVESVAVAQNAPVEVRVTLGGALVEDALGATVFDHITNALAPREISTCDDVRLPCGHPVFTASIVFDATTSTARIEIEDGLLHKRVERDLPLSGMPEDAWPLAIAIATDELLRACWTELLLVDAPKTSVSPPPQIVESVENTTRPSRTLRPLPNALGVAADAVLLSSRATGVGALVRYDRLLAGRFGIGLRLAWLRVLPKTSEHGSVSADLLGGGAGVWIAIIEKTDRATLAGFGRLDVYAARFVPVASGDGGERRKVFPAVLGAVGLHGTIALGRRVQLFAEAALAGPLLGAAAYDSGEEILAIRGVGGEASLGTAIDF